MSQLRGKQGKRRVLAVWLLVPLLGGCASELRQRELDEQLNTLSPDAALELLAQKSQDQPDDLDLRSRYLQMRRQIVDAYIGKASVAYEGGDSEQALEWARKAQQAAPGDDGPRAMIEWIERQGPIDAAINYAASIRITRADEALTALHDVLEKQPGNTRASKLRDEILAARTPELTATLGRDLNKPISVQFRDQPLISIFELVSNITGLNFTFDKDVPASAPTTIFANNTPVRQVLSMVLQANQLASKIVSGNSVLIYPKRQDKKAEYRDLTVRTFYLQNAQAQQVLAMLKQMVKTRDVVLDERTNAIIMRDAPETIRVAERLIAALDVAPAEVVIEAQVLEVSTSDLLQLGIKYPTSAQFSLQSSGDDGQQRVPGYITMDELRRINGGNVLVQIGPLGVDFLQSQGKTKTLATPRIRVRNREKAKVLIGDRLPVVTTTLSSNFSSESVNYQDVGLTLEVAPVIVGDNEVQVKLRMEVSNVTDTIETSTGLVAYQIGTRTAETVMSVRNNETQVLAGLLQRNQRDAGSGLPGLSRIPGFDRIFGTKTNDGRQTELILMLTPRVVRNQAMPAGNVVSFDSGTEARVTTERDLFPTNEDVVVPPKGVQIPPPPLQLPGATKTDKARSK